MRNLGREPTARLLQACGAGEDMSDERQESTTQGIAPAPESAIERNADRQREEKLRNAPEETRPDGAMGGTSDADSPADEAWLPRDVE
jgi:hypothetical protein